MLLFGQSSFSIDNVAPGVGSDISQVYPMNYNLMSYKRAVSKINRDTDQGRVSSDGMGLRNMSEKPREGGNT